MRVKKDKRITREQEELADRQKTSYYCPYCGHTNAIPHKLQQQLLNEHKKLICNFCHHGFYLDGLKTVYDKVQIQYLQRQFKKFLEKRDQPR